MWRFLLLLAAISADAGRYGPFRPADRSHTCFSVCPAIYQPICALCADGHETTFQNECHLGRLNSCDGLPKCSKVRDGECQPKCDLVCPAVYQPICAFCDDGEETTFGSECQLDRHNTCEPNNQCSKVRDGECEAQCDIVCTALYQPVCALCDDGQEATFGNDCELDRQNTCNPNNQECTKLRDGGCMSLDPRPSGPRPSGPRPSEPMPSFPKHPDPRPSYPRHMDHRTSDPRPSDLFFPGPSDPRPSDHNPSTSGKYIPEPFRPRAPGPRPTCPVACPAIYQPVCADCQEGGETTFENICDLEAANTCNPQNQCTKLRNGECTPPSDGSSDGSEPGCDIICPLVYQPVCAQCPEVGEWTFQNDCDLTAFNACNPNPCFKQRDGECGPSAGRPSGPWSNSPSPSGPWSRGPQQADPWSHGQQPARHKPSGPKPASPKSSGPFSHDPQSADPWSHGPQPADSWSKGPRPASPNPSGPRPSGQRPSGQRPSGQRPSGPRPSGPRPSGPSGASCSIACPLIYQPVCARCMDGSEQTFGNTCQLGAQNSCNPLNQCTQIYDGECRGVEVNPGGPLCPDACTEDYRPVCAQCPSGRQTFGNACSLQQHNCQTGEECILLQEGTCEGCIRPCPLNEAPVCSICNDNRYRTFPNTCLMENFNCQNRDNCRNVSRAVGNTCPSHLPSHIHGVPPPSSRCDRLVCPAIYQPVCARCKHGAVTFQNSCALDSHNCKKNNECEKIRDGECPPCPQTRCSSEKNPICAQCGKEKRTFDNECLFNTHNCPTGFECTKLHNGTCEGAMEVCPRACTREYSPVCAQCPNGPKTFSNLCVLQQNNCQSRPGCTYLRDGQCSSSSSSSPSSSSSSSCEKACSQYNIQICARCANNVYRNFPNTCHMDNHNCRTNENCQYVSQGEKCPANPSQPQDNLPSFPTDPAECAAISCSTAREPVCARCGPKQMLRTFNNGCLLNIYNCFNDQECTKIRNGACQESPEPVICPTQRDPVCATCMNGPRTFPNRCFLSSYQILNPQDNCTEIYQGTCQTTCPLLNCLDIEQPICALCGFEQKTFANQCFFNSYNCPAGYECTKISDGPCSSVPPLICTGEHQPVCATCSTGLETFANLCFLNAHNLANPDARCLPRNEGSCSDISGCPQVKCPSTSAPVCGVCGNQRMTFINECQFRSYNCKNGYACRMQSSGSCQ